MIDLTKLRSYKNPLFMMSGGKDSIAMLYYLANEGFTQFEIVWVDTGKNFQTIKDTIAKLKIEFPNIKFTTLNSDRDKNWEQFGMPSDILPMKYTLEGESYQGSTKIRLQSVYSCCSRNIMQPVFHYAKAIGCELLIRGNKIADEMKDWTRSWSVIDGITFYHPIENWTDEECREYIRNHASFYPHHLDYKHSSLDCKDCTGYWKDSKDRVEYMMAVDSTELTIMEARLKVIRTLVLAELSSVDELLRIGANNDK